MKALIIGKKELNNDDLAVRVILENEVYATLRFPGIKKSLKRSDYNLYPGNLIHFPATHINFEKQYVTEFQLIKTLIPQSPDYESLQNIADMFFAVNKAFYPEQGTDGIYAVWENAIFPLWIKPREQALAIYFNLEWLNLQGLVNFSEVCQVCGKKRDANHRFLLPDGWTCKTFQNGFSLPSSLLQGFHAFHNRKFMEAFNEKTEWQTSKTNLLDWLKTEIK